MASEEEIATFLKNNNLTEAQVDLMWSELIPLNNKVAILNKQLGTWKNCSINIIQKIPNQKERDLERIQKEKEAEEKAKKEAEKKLQEQKYYEENFENIMLNKIDNKGKLSEEEIERLAYGNYVIDSVDIDIRRRTVRKNSIVQLGGRAFRIFWDRGLTEYQDDIFEPQIPIEVKQITKMVEVKEWVKLEQNNGE